MAHQIDDLAKNVEKLWEFSTENYPGFGGLIPRDAQAIRHILMHVGKDLGRITTAIEPFDHHPVVSTSIPELLNFDTRRPVRNLLVCALRLCSLLDLKPSELIADYTAEELAQKTRER